MKNVRQSVAPYHIMVSRGTYPDRPVSSAGEQHVALRTECHGPDLVVMALECMDQLPLVAVPVLDEPVFAAREEVMCLRHEDDLRHCVVVREERFVTVTKVHAPDLNVLVRTARDDQRVVV